MTEIHTLPIQQIFDCLRQQTHFLTWWHSTGTSERLAIYVRDGRYVYAHYDDPQRLRYCATIEPERFERVSFASAPAGWLSPIEALPTWIPDALAAHYARRTAVLAALEGDHNLAFEHGGRLTLQGERFPWLSVIARGEARPIVAQTESHDADLDAWLFENTEHVPRLVGLALRESIHEGERRLAELHERLVRGEVGYKVFTGEDLVVWRRGAFHRVGYWIQEGALKLSSCAAFRGAMIGTLLSQSIAEGNDERGLRPMPQGLLDALDHQLDASS